MRRALGDVLHRLSFAIESDDVNSRRNDLFWWLHKIAHKVAGDFA